jgi:hypothetical protein
MKHVPEEPSTDEAIRAVVARLARPHRSGGSVIERAAIMAEGTTAPAILDWLATAAWLPEDPPAARRTGGSGLHGLGRESQHGRSPRRYVSPPPPV